MVMTDKVQITYEDLEGLAKLARAHGTEGAFIPLALQWAKAAVDEVARLQAEVTSALQVARAQNAKLMAMTDEPGGIERLRKVLDEAGESKIDPLLLANEITKGLFPEIYGKSLEALVKREIVHGAIKQYLKDKQ